MHSIPTGNGEESDHLARLRCSVCRSTRMCQHGAVARFCNQIYPQGPAPPNGKGHPPQQPCHPELAQAGSAWDDWCGEYRRKGNHPAGSYIAADVATTSAGACLRVCDYSECRAWLCFWKAQGHVSCSLVTILGVGCCLCEQKIRPSTFRQRCVVQ